MVLSIFGWLATTTIKQLEPPCELLYLSSVT